LVGSAGIRGFCRRLSDRVCPICVLAFAVAGGSLTRGPPSVPRDALRLRVGFGLRRETCLLLVHKATLEKRKRSGKLRGGFNSTAVFHAIFLT
jgi:hypothetical protein